MKGVKVQALILFNFCPQNFLVDVQLISVLSYWRCGVLHFCESCEKAFFWFSPSIPFFLKKLFFG